MGDALAITVSTEDGAVRSGLSEAELRALIERIGGTDDQFAVVDRQPAVADVFVQVWRDRRGPYSVEFRDGSADRHFRTEIADADVVATLFVDWARGGSAWRSGHDWQPLDLRVPELSAEIRTRVEQHARDVIDAGFLTPDRAAVAVTDYFGPDESVSVAQARPIVDQVWQERVVEQAQWPERTDVDQLLAAFSSLDANGIVARPDFTCCSNCGVSEIGAEAQAGARGFVFFHRQDTERAVRGGGVWLTYGSMPDSPDDTLAVGREVSAALTTAGLPVVWNDSADKAIHVTPLDWKHRLPVD